MMPYDQGYADGKEGRTANSPDDAYGRSQYLQGYNVGRMAKDGIAAKMFAPGTGGSRRSDPGLLKIN